MITIQHHTSYDWSLEEDITDNS